MPLKDHLSSILSVFTRRQPARSEGYKASELSERLRSRILLLIRDVVSGEWPPERLGLWGDYTQEYWNDLHNKLQHLHGRQKLSNDPQEREPREDALGFILSCTPPEFFDFLELSFRTPPVLRILPDGNELVDAINEIFRVENAPHLTRLVTVGEHDATARFGKGGTVIRTVAHPQVILVDEQPTHTEAVQPALTVLAAPHFEAANLEFRDALEEYRKGHYGDCLTKCCSSFESVMKSLCRRKAWQFNENKDTAAPLLKTIIAQSNLDPFFEQPLMLIATMRNRLSSSHGGGTSIRSVERHVAQYGVTSTAGAILLLVHEIEG